jgi:hypothetical protein
LGIDALFTPFLTHYSRADRLLEVLRKSAYTRQIEEADKERDSIFSSLYGTVKLACHQPDAAKRQAAESLVILLGHYKDITLRGSYSEESGALYNLWQDLTGAYAATVSLLGLDEWTTALRQAEDRFLTLYGERHSESADKPKSELAKVRRTTDHYYVNMMNQLDILLLAAGYGEEDDLATGHDGDDTDEGGGADDGGADDGGGSEGAQTLGGASAPQASTAPPVPAFVIAWNEKVKKYRNLLAQRKGRRARKGAETGE